jgi:alpha-L-fucosidase 2
MLPAQPKQWHTGQRTGLRARGNAEVNLAWKNGRLVGAEVKTFSTGRLYLRFRDQTVSFTAEAGKVYRFDNKLNRTIEEHA